MSLPLPGGVTAQAHLDDDRVNAMAKGDIVMLGDSPNEALVLPG